MRGTIMVFVGAALVLAGCGLGDGPSITDRATETVRINLEQRLPGADVTPVTDCVIDNATSSELVTLAAQSPDSGATILGIIERPETLRCLAITAMGRALL